MKRISTTYRLSFVLAMVSTAPMIVYSLCSSLEGGRAKLDARVLSCEQFSIACTLCLQKDDSAILKRLASDLLQRDEDLAGIRIVRKDGVSVCEVGDFANVSDGDSSSGKDSNIISTSLFRLRQPWGSVDFNYRTAPQSESNFQVLAGTALGVLCNLIIFASVLRRSLSVLDTSKVVPTRVRNTLDTIPDGIVIIDAKGRVIVANDAFQKSTGVRSENLIGCSLDSIAFTPLDACLPWNDSKDSSKTKNGIKALLSLPDGDRFFTVGCSPIFDASEQHAGNLVSFQDITELEHQKRKIECTLKELGESKEQLRQQNEKLHELASKDMLTGVFNRRSLFEQLELCWNTASEEKQSMSVVMLDVDHFKKLNDGHGHAVGDQVLRDVAAVIRKSAPEKSVVGRYGGEEFCVVLPDLDSNHAVQAADAIRQAIQAQLETPYRVTASIGVASNSAEAEGFKFMLDRADKALYSAKHAGRNRVHCWSNALLSIERSSHPSVSADQPLTDSLATASSEKELSAMVQELVEITSIREKPHAEMIPARDD